MLFRKAVTAVIAMTTLAFVAAVDDSSPVALDNVNVAEEGEEQEDAYIPGTNLRRKLKAPSGSDASMTFIIGYSPDRVMEDCDSLITTKGGKQMSIDDMMVGNANALAAKAGIKKSISKVPFTPPGQAKKSVLSLDTSVAPVDDDADDEDRRKLPGDCPCLPGSNCEACCLFFCYGLGYQCMAGNHLDPCEVGSRRLQDVTYDNIVDEVRRLEDITTAQETAIEYQAELQRVAGLLVEVGNMCLGRPGDIWVTAEIYEGSNAPAIGTTYPAEL